MCDLLKEKPFLRSIQLDRASIEDESLYPFNIPSIKKLESIEFHPDVTFLVGENGSGKSTLIEALAVMTGLGREGGTKNVNFETANTISPLSNYLDPIRGIKLPRDYYFLRAESFYNVATYMDGLGYSYGDKSFHEQSHGEAFMSLLLDKLNGSGLYFFDEPEAALSPNRLLAALSVINDLVEKNSQFIIATHSPILLSYPRAKILNLDKSGIHEVTYEETDHYKVTRGYLNNYHKMLEILMKS